MEAYGSRDDPASPNVTQSVDATETHKGRPTQVTGRLLSRPHRV